MCDLLGRSHTGLRHPQVGVARQFRRPLASSFRQIPLGQYLQPQGDALDQPRAIVGSRFFAKQLSISLRVRRCLAIIRSRKSSSFPTFRLLLRFLFLILESR